MTIPISNLFQLVYQWLINQLPDGGFIMSRQSKDFQNYFYNMTPSIVESQTSMNSSKQDRSSFSLSGDDFEQSKSFKNNEEMEEFAPNDKKKVFKQRTKSVRELRTLLKNSLQTKKQIFQSVEQNPKTNLEEQQIETYRKGLNGEGLFTSNPANYDMR